MAAGMGERLSPLSDKSTKCLIPIGNIPMLWYPMRSLDLCGFKGKSLVLNKIIFNIATQTEYPFNLLKHCKCDVSLFQF